MKKYFFKFCLFFITLLSFNSVFGANESLIISNYNNGTNYDSNYGICWNLGENIGECFTSTRFAQTPIVKDQNGNTVNYSFSGTTFDGQQYSFYKYGEFYYNNIKYVLIYSYGARVDFAIFDTTNKKVYNLSQLSSYGRTKLMIHKNYIYMGLYSSSPSVLVGKKINLNNIFDIQDYTTNLSTWIGDAVFGNFYVTSSNFSQIIYYKTTNKKFYLYNIEDVGNNIISYELEIFKGSLLGHNLERLLLPYDTSLITINKFRFKSINTLFGVNYYLSLCTRSQTFTVNQGTGTINKHNITLFATEENGGVSQGFYNLEPLGFLDYINFGKLLYTFDNSQIINYGIECSDNYIFSNFTDNIPSRIYVNKPISMYLNILSPADISLISQTPTGSGNTFLQDTGLTQTEVTDDLLNIDIDGNGSVDAIEVALAPLTIIKNIIVKLYKMFENVWTFFKAILNIGNIGSILFETTYAYTGDDVLYKILDKTDNFYSSGSVGAENIHGFIIFSKYGFFFLMFFCILLLFFILYLKNK